MSSRNKTILTAGLIGFVIGVAVYLGVSRQSQKQDFLAQQDSLEQRLVTLQDSLAYQRLVEKANIALFSNRLQEGMGLLDSAETIHGHTFKWREIILANIETNDSLSQVSQNLDDQRDKALTQLHLNEMVNEEFLDELQYRRSYIDSLDRLLRKTQNLADSLELKGLEQAVEIQRLQKAFGRNTIENPDAGSITYFGALEDGMAQGFGFGLFESGGIYYGNWENNQRHGEGIYRWTNGDSYTGSFFHGKPQGQGTYQFHTGERYEGEWLEGRRHGYGEVYNESGKLVLQGTWNHDKFQEDSSPGNPPPVHP